VIDETGDDRGPDWSPDGQQIAFGHLLGTGQMDIHTINDDGSGVFQVTSAAGFESTPDWRPLHDQIAFRADWGTALDIHMVDTDGTDLTGIVVDANRNSSPSWSPDGTRLAFNSNRDGNTDIWIIDVSGPSPGTFEKVTDDAGDDAEVEWSPDGNHFAIIRDHDVWVVSYPQLVYTQLTATATYEKEVSWSHDSAWIAFVSDAAGSDDIYVVHRTGGEPFRVTYDAGFENQPSWSPVAATNRRIVYSSEQATDSSLWIVEVAFE
jgi:Tol biopolymer transport system component